MKTFVLYFPVLLGAICFSGLLFQIYHISRQYFKYKTRTAINIFIPDVLPNPAVHTCHRFVDMINFDHWNKHKKSKFKKPIKTEQIMEIFDNITVNEILKWTPSTDEILADCSYRKPGQSVYQQKLGRETCNRLFDVGKYFHREFICYSFRLSEYGHQNKIYSTPDVILTQAWQRTLFTIVFNESSIMYSDYMTAYAELEDTNLLFLASYTSFGVRIIDYKTMKPFNNFVAVTNYLRKSSRRPPPYDTNCRDFGPQKTYADVYYKCINDEMSRRVSRVQIVLPIYSNKMLATKLFLPSSKDSRLIEANEESVKICQERIGPYREACNICISVSNPDLRKETAHEAKDEKLAVQLVFPKHFNFKLTNEPLVTLIEYFVYIFSTLGTWYGFSFFGFGSFLHGILFKKKQKIKVSQSKDILQYNTLMEKRLMDRITSMIMTSESMFARAHRNLWKENEKLRADIIQLNQGIHEINVTINHQTRIQL